MIIDLETLKYPIGRFYKPEIITSKDLDEYIDVIHNFPYWLKQTIKTLEPEHLEKRYRPGGWTLKQVVHHCADSHLNSFLRFKLTLTEDLVTIKPYREDLWTEMADEKDHPVTDSLILLTGLHARWTVLMNAMHTEDWNRSYYHPENKEFYTLKESAALYSWHCLHHLAHLKTKSYYQD